MEAPVATEPESWAATAAERLRAAAVLHKPMRLEGAAQHPLRF
jgi:hypothetical protein